MSRGQSVKIFHYRKNRYALAFIAIFSFLAPGAGVLFPVRAVAQNASQEEPIQIQAETLVADNASRYAEFIGNVKATQGNTQILADRLRIHYRSGATQETGAVGSGEDAIEKIVAEGNVTITFDDKKAVTDQAVYTLDDRRLVLTGQTSKVTSGKDSITGSKIIVERVTGKIRVESSRKQPVEAIFFPGKKGLE